MKRPLVLVGFCYLLTLAAAVFFGAEISFVLFWACAAGAAASLLRRRTRRAAAVPLALCTAAASLAAFCLYTRFAVEPPRALDGRDLEVEATVCELPSRRYGRWYYIARVDRAEGAGAPAGFKIRISSSAALEAGPYSRVRGRFHLFLPPGGEGYSSRGYYASKGVMLFAYPLAGGGDVQVLPAVSRPPYYYALTLRQRLLGSVDALLPPDEAALLNGVLLGDTDGLSEDLVADFRTDGVSHILSVSGLHMATVAELLMLLLLFLHVPKRAASLAAGCGVLGFMAVACFVPPVTRSGVMCLLCLAAPVLSRRADPLNSLCVSALLICLSNPYAAADVGLLLSFSATLGLVLFAGPAARFLNARLDRVPALSPLIRAADGVLATTAAATLFTLPVVLLSFGTLSAVAPLANLLELVPSSLMIAFGGAAAVLNLVLPQSFLAMPFALAAGLLAKYMRACAAALARLPGAGFSASQGFVPLWLGGAALLLAAALALGRGKRLLPQAACLSVLVLLAGVLSYQIPRRGEVRLAVLDSGTGVAAVLTRDGHAAVVGCGGYDSNAVLSYVQEQNVRRLDALAVLTPGRQELSCAAGLAGRYPPECAVAQEGNRVDGFWQSAAARAGRSVLYRQSARVWLWGGAASVETRSCGGAEAAWIRMGGVSVLLLPAAADAAALPRKWREPDFLVTDAPPGGETPAALCTVFAMEEDDLAAAQRAVRSRRCVWTGGCGNVVLELKGNRTLSVGREQ